MGSLRAFIGETFGAEYEYRNLLYYTVIVFACLSMFRRTRRWVLFPFRACWTLGSQLWINLFLCFSYYADWDDGLIKRLLEHTKIDREPMTWKEIWYGIMGWKTKKQKLREKYKEMHKEREPHIWYGLVTPESQMLDGEEPWAPRKRKTWGMVESVAKPVKEYSGSVRGHGDGTIRHTRYGSSGSTGNIRHGSSGSVGSICEGQNGQVGEAGQASQAGQTGTIGRKKNTGRR